MRNTLTIVCVLAVAACGDPATNDDSNETDIAPDASALVAHDAAGDAQLEPDASEPDAGAHASDASEPDAGAHAQNDAGDASAGDASADSGVVAPASVVLTQASYNVLWDRLLAARCRECHGTVDFDDAAPIIDRDFGIEPLLRISDCNGMPYVTPGDPSQSLLWRALQPDAPCGLHPDTKLRPPLKLSELDVIAAWIRGELEPR